MAVRMTHRRSSSSVRVAGLLWPCCCRASIHTSPACTFHGQRGRLTAVADVLAAPYAPGGLVRRLRAPSSTARRCCPRRPLKTCFSSILQLSAETGEDLVRRYGDAGRPELDEQDRLGALSTAMCSAPTEAAAAAIAVGATGRLRNS